MLSRIVKSCPLLALVLLLCGSASAQYSSYSNTVWDSNGHFASYATIRVCPEPAQFTAGVCTNLATIYTSKDGGALANPFQADQYGNYSFFGSAGFYTIQQSGPGVVQATMRYVLLPALADSTLYLDNYCPVGGQYTDACLTAAMAVIGSKHVNLVVPSGETYVLGANVSVPANINLVFNNGGIMQPASGVTLQLAASIVAGNYQIFDESKGGSIVIGATDPGPLPVGGAATSAAAGNIFWFGAQCANSDDSTAIQEALAAFGTAVIPYQNINLTSGTGTECGVKEPVVLAQGEQLVGQTEQGGSNNSAMLVQQSVQGPVVIAGANSAAPAMAASLVSGPGAAFDFSNQATTEFAFKPETSSLDVNGLSAFTAEAWVEITGALPSHGAYVFQDNAQNYRPAHGGWYLAVNQDGTPSFQVAFAGTTHEYCNGSVALQQGVVYHLSMTYDGSTLRGFVGQPGQTVSAAACSVSDYPNTPLADYPDDQGYFGTNAPGSAVAPILIDGARASNIVRYTTPFVAPAAKFTVDSHTMLLINGDGVTNNWITAQSSAGDIYLVPEAETNGGGSIRNVGILSNNSVGLFVNGAVSETDSNVFVNGARCGVCLTGNSFSDSFQNLNLAAITEVGMSNYYSNHLSGGGLTVDNVREEGGIIGLSLEANEMTVRNPFVADNANSLVAGLVLGGGNVYLYNPLVDTENSNPEMVAGTILDTTNNAVFGGDFFVGGSAPPVAVYGTNTVTSFTGSAFGPSTGGIAVHDAGTGNTIAFSGSLLRSGTWSDNTSIAVSSSIGPAATGTAANEVMASPDGSAGSLAPRKITNSDLPGSGAVTVYANGPLAGGGSVALGGTITVGCPTCATGGAGAAFSQLTSGTNNAAAMIVDTGASLAATGTGTIAATSVPAGGVSSGIFPGTYVFTTGLKVPSLNDGGTAGSIALDAQGLNLISTAPGSGYGVRLGISEPGTGNSIAGFFNGSTAMSSIDLTGAYHGNLTGNVTGNVTGTSVDLAGPGPTVPAISFNLNSEGVLYLGYAGSGKLGIGTTAGNTNGELDVDTVKANVVSPMAGGATLNLAAGTFSGNAATATSATTAATASAVAASGVSAGTFGAGNFTFPGNVTFAGSCAGAAPAPIAGQGVICGNYTNVDHETDFFSNDQNFGNFQWYGYSSAQGVTPLASLARNELDIDNWGGTGAMLSLGGAILQNDGSNNVNVGVSGGGTIRAATFAGNASTATTASACATTNGCWPNTAAAIDALGTLSNNTTGNAVSASSMGFGGLSSGTSGSGTNFVIGSGSALSATGTGTITATSITGSIAPDQVSSGSTSSSISFTNGITTPSVGNGGTSGLLLLSTDGATLGATAPLSGFGVKLALNEPSSGNAIVGFYRDTNLLSEIDYNGNFTGNAATATTANAAPFSGLTSGTNSGAAMVVMGGGSLNVAGVNNGLIRANDLSSDSICTYGCLDVSTSGRIATFSYNAIAKSYIDSNGNFTGNAATASTASTASSVPASGITGSFTAAQIATAGTLSNGTTGNAATATSAINASTASSANGLKFGSTVLSNSGTVPATGQCLGWSGSVITGYTCAGGSGLALNEITAATGSGSVNMGGNQWGLFGDGEAFPHNLFTLGTAVTEGTYPSVTLSFGGTVSTNIVTWNIATGGANGYELNITNPSPAAGQLNAVRMPGLHLTNAVAVASLYACGSAAVGLRTLVSDSTSATPGTALTGGGSVQIGAECIYNGSAYEWIVD